MLAISLCYTNVISYVKLPQLNCFLNKIVGSRGIADQFELHDMMQPCRPAHTARHELCHCSSHHLFFSLHFPHSSDPVSASAIPMSSFISISPSSLSTQTGIHCFLRIFFHNTETVQSSKLAKSTYFPNTVKTYIQIFIHYPAPSFGVSL